MLVNIAKIHLQLVIVERIAHNFNPKFKIKNNFYRRYFD